MYNDLADLLALTDDVNAGAKAVGIVANERAVGAEYLCLLNVCRLAHFLYACGCARNEAQRLQACPLPLCLWLCP